MLVIKQNMFGAIQSFIQTRDKIKRSSDGTIINYNRYQYSPIILFTDDTNYVIIKQNQ